MLCVMQRVAVPALQPCRLCKQMSLQHKRNTRQAFRCAAAQDGNQANITPVTTGNIGPLKLVNDRETFLDVMAFTGPAPEVASLPIHAIVCKHYSGHCIMLFM